MRKLVLTTALILASTIAIVPTARANELEAQSTAFEYLRQSEGKPDVDPTALIIARKVVRDRPALVLGFAHDYCKLAGQGHNPVEAAAIIHNRIKTQLDGQPAIAFEAGIRVVTGGFYYAIDKKCRL